MTDELAAYAAQIAPHLDRLRMGVMKTSVELGMRSGVLTGSGLDPDTSTVFAMLRNAFPDRAVPLASYRAVYVYQDPGKLDRALSVMTQAGLVEQVGAAAVALTPSGRDLMRRVREVGCQAADELWAAADAGPLLRLADRCVTEAARSAEPGGAFHVVAPPHDEPGDSDAARLAERLTGLRWHRFDAHVAAWRAAGLTAETITELPPGPVRERIETETNERAGKAYGVLTPDERSELLQGLTRLA